MIAAILGLLLSAAHAEPVYAVTPIDGYVCMRLNVTESQVLDPKGTGIFILTAPESSAPHGTPAPGILFVKKPEHRVNGYLEVLQLTNQPGWIAADKVVPFDPNYRCVPSVMSNGRLGGG